MGKFRIKICPMLCQISQLEIDQLLGPLVALNAGTSVVARKNISH